MRRFLVKNLKKIAEKEKFLTDMIFNEED